MAGYGGYFLQGLSSGLQTGFNMGQQMQEMKYQKTQRKKLEEKQEKIKEGMTNFSNLINQYGADKVYSDDEIMQLSTALWASIPEVQAVYKDTLNAIQTMNKKKFEEDMQWLDLVIDRIDGLDPKDLQGIFDYTKSWVKTEKGKNYFMAYENLHKKTYEAGQEQKTWERAGTLPQNVRPDYLRQEGVKIPKGTPEAPTMADEKSAINLLRIFVNATPEKFEEQKRRTEQSTGLDLSIYTQDVLKEEGSEFYNLYNTPEEVSSKVKAPAGLMVVPSRDSKTGKYYATFQKKATTTTTPGGTRATSLPQQEKYRQDALDANTWTEAESTINRYAKAGYDTSEMPVKQDWINAKLEELDSHVEMLNEITDEKGRLLGDKQFKFMSGDEEESKTGAEWYKAIYEAFMFYLEELKKMGIDVSKYQKIKAPKEVSKVGFLKGAFTSAKSGYPSIYYTETSPTPTETEIPKLPSL